MVIFVAWLLLLYIPQQMKDYKMKTRKKPKGEKLWRTFYDLRWRDECYFNDFLLMKNCHDWPILVLITVFIFLLGKHYEKCTNFFRIILLICYYDTHSSIFVYTLICSNCWGFQLFMWEFFYVNNGKVFSAKIIFYLLCTSYLNFKWNNLNISYIKYKK